MAAGKECTGCGSNNELILLNCAYCGTQLPTVDTDEKGISTEELLQNCSAWIGKFEAITSDYYTLRASKNKDAMGGMMGGKLMTMTMSDDALSYSGTLSAINRYLDLLDVKASESSTLKPKVEELKKRFNEAKENEANVKNPNILFGAIAGSFFIGLFVWGYIASSDAGEASDAEHKRLEAIVENINTSIANGNMDAAEIFSSQLVWGYQDSWTNHDKEMETWDKKRKELLESIRKIRNRE